MDIEKLTKETILKNMSPEQQKAVLESVMASVQESKKARSVKIAENVDLVMQALKKIEAQMLAKVTKATDLAETAAKNVKDGKDGRDGKDGKDGKQGAIGPKGSDGRDGKDGKDGKDGRDGIDGVSVVNAFLDFDNSLVIELSNGKQINVGGMLSDETADKVRVVANGGGTSQGVLDAIAALQADITNLIPAQAGNAGKFLSTDGTNLSWIGGGGGLSYQGTWNASTNSPALSSGVGTNGYYYVVSTTGTTNLDGITAWTVGDWAIFNGTNWQKIDNTDLVTSVAGRTGDITLSNSDVSGSAASGANSDITSLSGITGAIGTADYVAFDTAYATTLGVGQLGWDGNNTLGLGMYGGNVVQRIGEDTYFYVKASSAITKGQVCMFTGAVGASGVVTAAPATGVTNGQYIMGIAAESISLNDFGLIQCFGTLRNINTTGFSDGDIVYYNSAITGGFTKTYPTSGPIVTVAAVVNGGSASGGVLQIRVSVTQRITAGTGISVTQNGTGTTITNGIDLASPPAIGGTTPAAGTFTTLTSTGQTSLGGAAGSESFRAVTNAGGNIRVQATSGIFGTSPAAVGLETSSGTGATLSVYNGSQGSIAFYTSGISSTQQLRVSHTASAVNYVQVTGAATTSSPVISAQGSDANIGITLNSKGTGTVLFQTNGTTRASINSGGTFSAGILASGVPAFIVAAAASQVNYVQVNGAATGIAPSFQSTGTDTNIDLALTPKGTGKVTTTADLNAANVVASAGVYSKAPMTATYTDGIVADYTNGNGRISVGPADTLTFYNGGVASTQLAQLDVKGNLQINGGIYVNSQTIAANYTIPAGSSGHSAGPITVSSGVSVTVSSGSKWVVL